MVAWNGLKRHADSIRLFSSVLHACKKMNFLFTTVPFFFFIIRFRQLCFFIWNGHSNKCISCLKNYFGVITIPKFSVSMFVFNLFFQLTKWTRYSKRYQYDQHNSRGAVGMAWTFWRGISIKIIIPLIYYINI